MDDLQAPLGFLAEALTQQTPDLVTDKGVRHDTGSEESVDHASTLGNHGKKGEVSRW